MSPNFGLEYLVSAIPRQLNAFQRRLFWPLPCVPFEVRVRYLMLWTTHTPTNPGWYWLRVHKMKPRVIEVIAQQEPQRLLIADSSTPVDTLEGSIYQWAGPLDSPEEPSESEA